MQNGTRPAEAVDVPPPRDELDATYGDMSSRCRRNVAAAQREVWPFGQAGGATCAVALVLDEGRSETTAVEVNP